MVSRCSGPRGVHIDGGAPETTDPANSCTFFFVRAARNGNASAVLYFYHLKAIATSDDAVYRRFVSLLLSSVAFVFRDCIVFFLTLFRHVSPHRRTVNGLCSNKRYAVVVSLHARWPAPALASALVVFPPAHLVRQDSYPSRTVPWLTLLVAAWPFSILDLALALVCNGFVSSNVLFSVAVHDF